LTDEIDYCKLGRLDPERLGVNCCYCFKTHRWQIDGKVGRTLDVQYALEGSVRRGGNQVRIDVQLIQVSDQTNSGPILIPAILATFLHVQDEVAAAVAGQIRVALPVGALGVNGAKGTARAVNRKRTMIIFRGRFYWTNRGDLHKSIEAIRTPFKKDPSYALAYAGLASGYALLGQVPYDDMPPIQAKPKAREAAERALQLDPQLGEAHSVLANVSFSYDWILTPRARVSARPRTRPKWTLPPISGTATTASCAIAFSKRLKRTRGPRTGSRFAPLQHHAR